MEGEQPPTSPPLPADRKAAGKGEEERELVLTLLHCATYSILLLCVRMI